MTARPELAPWLHSLPPMLHTVSPDSVPSYSKAPRGLFVQLWVTRIFTGISISPSPSLRQRPSRYTIRAGRNLPDKGLRYLRTVIVTAAAYQGFSSKLWLPELLSLTSWRWAGVSSYTSAYAFAETCVFVKQSLGPILCHPPKRAPLIPKLRG
jgi:hypothetical protein